MYKRFFEALKVKKIKDYMFDTYYFYINNMKIGAIFIKTKNHLNQFHIDILPEFQNHGYSKELFEYAINKYNYISIPEGRVLNPLIFKIIENFKHNEKYEVFNSIYNEFIISNKKLTKEELNKIFELKTK